MSKTTIIIDGDSSGFEKAAKEVSGQLTGLSSNVKTATSTANLAFASFLGNLTSQAVSSAFSVITNGFATFKSVLAESIKEAEGAEDETNRLNDALVRTGKYAPETSKRILDLSDSLETLSRFEGGDITDAATSIQTLAGLSADALERATRATADFAASQKLDIKSAGELVGKALGGNISMLSRYGIELKSTGDKAKDVEIALSALESKFGGAALASIQGYGGATAKTANDQKAFLTEIGNVITTSPAYVGAIQAAGDVLRKLSTDVKNNKSSLQTLVEDGVMLLVDSLEFAGKSINFFLDLKEGFKAFGSFIADTFLAIVQKAQEFHLTFSESAQAIKEMLGVDTANSEESIKAIQAKIDITKLAREALEKDTIASIQSNESLKSSITSVTDTVREAFLARINAAKEAGSAEIEAELEKQSQLNAIRLANEEAEKNKDAFTEEEFFAQNASRLQYIQDILGEEERLREESRIRELIEQGKYNAAIAQLSASEVKARKADIFKIQDYEKLSQSERVSNLKSTMGTIASLQSSSSKELFLIGKAASISMATVDGILAVQKALASAPPPFNYALAAAVGVATAANIAKIASAQPPTGAFDGALVEGGSTTRDTEPFMLSKGEIVAPRRSFDEVVEGTARQRGFVKQDEVGPGGGISISIQGDVIGDELFVNNLIEKIRDAVQFRNANLGVG